MRWHIVTQVGQGDDFLPDIPEGDGRLVVAIDKPGHQGLVANQLLRSVRKAGYIPPQPALDLLHLALAIYFADLRVWRGYTKDRWTRDIVVYGPVEDPGSWSVASPILSRILSFLTGDSWEIVLRERAVSEPEAPRDASESRPQFVSLFSGGLDSFVGAIDLLGGKGQLALVGQYATRMDQTRAYAAIDRAHFGRTIPFWFHILPPRGRDMDGSKRKSEDTMRSRSLLFFALGTTVASAFGQETPLYVPENGLISLNIPLTLSRIGSSSTRTTHPYVIELYRELLAALGIGVRIETPYRFLTKGEMLAGVSDAGLLASGIHETMSCSRPVVGRYRRLPVGVHCGYCVPCIIRRAALRVIGMDTEAHHYDVLGGDADPRQTRGSDRRAFEIAIARARVMRPLELVSEVVSTGPISPHDTAASVAVFQRGLEEVAQFLEA